MKIDRFIVAAMFVGALSVAPVFGQPRPATQTPPPPASTSQAVLPESKIALINSDYWTDEKEGIVRLVAAAKRVDTEFQARRTELQQLQTRIDTLTDDIKKTAAVADPKTIQQKQEQLDTLTSDAKRKQEDGQRAYQKRMNEVLAPIYEEIGKALDVYGKARGITLMLDIAKIGPAILMASETTDITRAFIADFNAKYPATAAVTTPPR